MFVKVAEGIDAMLGHATELGWLSPETAPKDGTKIDVWFLTRKQGPTLSRTCWLVKEGRWNGMSKGEEPLGWRHLPALPKFGGGK